MKVHLGIAKGGRIMRAESKPFPQSRVCEVSMEEALLIFEGNAVLEEGKIRGLTEAERAEERYALLAAERGNEYAEAVRLVESDAPITGENALGILNALRLLVKEATKG